MSWNCRNFSKIQGSSEYFPDITVKPFLIQGAAPYDIPSQRTETSSIIVFRTQPSLYNIVALLPEKIEYQSKI